MQFPAAQTRPGHTCLSEPTLLIVPGLRDHVPEHWQTHLQRDWPGAQAVEPLTHDKLSLAARVRALDIAIAAIDGPIVLVAHSAGALMAVHWAGLHGQQRAIQGALLATPSDVETPLPAGYPTLDQLRDGGWLPTPRQRLPFPAIVAASRNDPLARYERTAGFAADWGARLVDLGEVGHLNPASGYGPWPQARDWIQALP